LSLKSSKRLIVDVEMDKTIVPFDSDSVGLW
jgi:hypothetical protein